MRGELAALVDQGKSRDEIKSWFVSTYGNEEMLGAPLDEGFNRLAWLFPWSVGAGAALAVGFVAIRWSRHHEPEEPAAASTDPELNERLDDELRNLD
jgi:cytochrome c-type biogenesis protein CcmH/NrfF